MLTSFIELNNSHNNNNKQQTVQYFIEAKFIIRQTKQILSTMPALYISMATIKLSKHHQIHTLGY